MISTIINGEYVLGHPYFKRYGANKDGIVYNLITHLRAKRHIIQGLVIVTLRDEWGVKYMVPRSVFNYECFPQCVYIAKMPSHIDNDLTNDSEMNLYLEPVLNFRYLDIII